MTIIYHSKDMDGWLSGAIALKARPDAKLIGWDYGQPIPNIDDREDLTMIDIVFPIQVLKELLAKKIHDLVIIDHHISFNKEFFADGDLNIRWNVLYIYDNTMSACELAWQYYFNTHLIPRGIKLTGAYDVWRNQDLKYWSDHVIPFHYYMDSTCHSPYSVPYQIFLPDYQTEDFIGRAMSIGESILEYQTIRDNNACTRACFEKKLWGYNVLCLNQGIISSDTMNSVYDPNKHDLMLGFQYNGNFWNVSLRSLKSDIDISLVAKIHGGGGHKAAAGYESQTFEEIFMDPR